MLRSISSLLSGSRGRVRADRAVHAPEVEGEKRLRLRYTVSDIVDIDTVSQVFKVKILIHVRWAEDFAAFQQRTAELLAQGRGEEEKGKDIAELRAALNSLAAGPPEPVPWSAVKQVWDPKLFLENKGDELERTEENCTAQRVPEFPDKLWINYSMRLSGEFRCAMDLRQFPFDKQLLVVKILTQHPIKDNHNSGEAARIEGQRLTDEFARKWLKSENPAPSCLMLDEWHLGEESHEVIDHSNWEEFQHLSQRLKLAPTLQTYNSEKTYSRLYISIAMRRRPQFYITKIYAPLCLLASTTFSVYRIPEFGDQVATLVTILLAIVAYQYVVASMVPKIAYNTELDVYILGCFMIVLVIFLSCVALDFIKELELSPDPILVLFAAEAAIWIVFHFVMAHRVGMLKLAGRWMSGRARQGHVKSYFPLCGA